MGGVAKTVKHTVKNPVKSLGRGLGTVFTLGLNQTNLGNGAFKKAGDFVGNTLTLQKPGGDQQVQPTLDGFNITPEEIERDQLMILGEGEKQSGDILAEMAIQTELRKKRRDELAALLASADDRAFREAIPEIAEDSNAGGVYTGTGYSQALASERARSAANTREKLSLTALGDVDAELGLRNLATDRRLGSREAALGRGFSLEDFVRSANVARATGAQQAPQTGGGKGGFGETLSSLGQVAQVAAMIYPPTRPFAMAAGAAGAAGGTDASDPVVANSPYGPVRRSSTSGPKGKSG